MYAPVLEISTLPQLRSYTTLWNLRIQNNAETETWTRKTNLFYMELSKT